jgi:7-keto-8-aminopelargonate synthetase-like enzyme
MDICTTDTGELSFVTALNLSSYNYLGFAESDLEMREEVCSSYTVLAANRLLILEQVIAATRRYGISSVASRTEVFYVRSQALFN